MCGRYTHLFTWEELHRLSTLTTPRIDLPRSFNVAPTQTAPVVRMVEGGRGVEMLKWGLVPFWASDLKIGNSLINARGETVAEKPAFRAAFKARRCLVPVSGFYEWKKLEGPKVKQPYYIRAAVDEPLLLAGLWESWRDKSGASEAKAVETYTIVTTTPNELMAELHDRMPVVVDPSDQAAWLQGTVEGAKALIRPYPAELMMSYPVSTRVNSPRVNDELCIEKASDGLWS